jgi:hypothetical protein
VNFTNENILLVYTERITVEKKIKTKQKKYDNMSFILIELPTELILSVKSLVNCSLLPDTIHHVNYKGNHQQNIPLVFFREHWNCSLSNCTVNYCSLQIKS